MRIEHLPPLVIVLAALATAASCDHNTVAGLTTWKCFTVDSTTPPAPHTEANDRYCIKQQGADWFLEPGLGMENWRKIGGGERIPLEIRTDTTRVKIWEFEVDITDHPPASDHGHEHKKPDRSYLLQVNTPAAPGAKADAEIRVTGPSPDPIHGGTAHATE